MLGTLRVKKDTRKKLKENLKTKILWEEKRVRDETEEKLLKPKE